MSLEQFKEFSRAWKSTRSSKMFFQDSNKISSRNILIQEILSGSRQVFISTQNQER